MSATSMATPKAASTTTVAALITLAEHHISSAWHAYQQTDKHGLEFGRVCCGVT